MYDNASENQLDTLNCERRVAAVCAAPEAKQALRALEDHSPDHRDLLWLTWVQWRAMGREAMARYTGLSLWTINERLRTLREVGVEIHSSAQERELLACGRFFAYSK